jgi:hypothetical protein
MNQPAVPHLSAGGLTALSARARPTTHCAACASLVCLGWESLSAAYDSTQLRRIGTLRPDTDDELTLREHHPAGTNAWSADAPIAPAFYPYNRCDVWACRACGRLFLRYAEAGGYYVDERIREVDPRLIDETAL